MDRQIVLIKGIANFKPAYHSFLDKGLKVKEFDFDIPAIINELSQNHSVLVSLFYDETVLSLAAKIDAPVIVWLADKASVIIPEGLNLNFSRLFIFTLDPDNMLEFKKAGFQHTWLLPCNSGMEYSSILEETNTDDEKYACDISFVGESMTVQHNAYFQMYLNFSNLMKHLNQAVERQLNEFTINHLKEEYNRGDLNSFSLQFMKDFLEMINRREMDFTLGSEASSRLRKRLIKSLDGFNVKIFGDRHWGEVASKTVKFCGELHYPGETARAYSLSKINLNISKVFFSGTIQRVYDIVYCGGFCLTDYRHDVVRWFEPGKEIETYENAKEMVEKIRYYLEHDEKRIEIQKNGYKRLQKEHLVKHRTEFILDKVSALL